jgi:outer membrane protein
MNKFYNIALGVLFAISLTALILHFTRKKADMPLAVKNNAVADARILPIAFFKSDSITAGYEYYKEIEAELQKLSATVDGETIKLQQAFDSKNAEIENRTKAGASEEELLRLNQELNKMRTDYAERQENTMSNLQKQKQRFEAELKQRLTDFIKQYNTPQRFSYVLADEPGFFYFKDSALDITSELLAGLNAAYSKEKKK